MLAQSKLNAWLWRVWEQHMNKYRVLQHGEEIKDGDETDACRDGWRDKAKWEPAPAHMIGRKASDPACPAHSIYRRKVQAP